MTNILKMNPDAVAPVVAGNDVVIVTGVDLRPEPVKWLWNGYLAQGKIHILASPPGLGKTTIAMSMAATVTTGGKWPDGTKSSVGNILVWSGEDDAADTLLPRLLASSADRARCHFIQGAKDEDGSVRPFDPAKDIPALQIAMQRIGDVKLLIVDPIVSAISKDGNSNSDVRRGLQPLVDMANASGCAVLGISHFSKGGAGGEPAGRVVGSIAFSAVARVVLAVAKVKGDDGEEKRILVRAKSNIGPDDGGFEYALEQKEPLPGIWASHAVFGNAVVGSARDLLAEPDQEHSDGGGAPSNELPVLIWQELRSGQVHSKVVEATLKEAGYTPKQIRNARQKMNIKTIRATGSENKWYWRLADNFMPEKAWLIDDEYVTNQATEIDQLALSGGNLPKMPASETGQQGQITRFEGNLTTSDHAPIVTTSKPKEVF